MSTGRPKRSRSSGTSAEERRGVDTPRNGIKEIRLADGRLVSLRQLVMSTLDDPDIQVVCYFADIDDTDYGDDIEGLLED